MTTPKQRIAFIDALRGFTMILVVYSHIQFFGYQYTDFFNLTFIKFRMPLFFFISGFVLYKKERIWDYSTSISFLVNKFKVQIISTLIFFCLYIYVFNKGLYHSVGELKAGYWFTYTLFFYYLFYVCSIFLSKLLRNDRYEDAIVIMVAIAVFLLCCFTLMDKTHGHQRLIGVIGIPKWSYYVFFIFGTLVKKYYKAFLSILDNSLIMALIICAFFLLLIFDPAKETDSFRPVSFLLYGFMGVVIIFSVFKKNEEWFATDRHVSQWLQYIGRHTLDIYLLHYFFLPYHLECIGQLFKDYPSHTIELFISICIALMVISISLLVSKVLCTSPLLGEVLFGKKSRPRHLMPETESRK